MRLFKSEPLQKRMTCSSIVHACEESVKASSGCDKSIHSNSQMALESVHRMTRPIPRECAEIVSKFSGGFGTTRVGSLETVGSGLKVDRTRL